MRNIIFGIAIILISNSLNAMYTISGKVLNENDEPLAEANIAMVGTLYGTTSLHDGSYVLNINKPGEYKISVSFLGYITSLKTLTVDKNITLNFLLQKNDIIADEIIIKATTAGKKTPMAVKTLTKDEISQRKTSEDIPYLLSLTPSLVETSEAGIGIGYTNMRIRGSDATRTNVTVNGIPLNDAESQGVFWVNMPDFSSSVDKIQIQRGVGTSTNGAAAFGATVNFLTTGLNKEPYAEMSSSVGSYNTFKNSLAVGTGLLNNHFTIDARYSKLKTDGYIDYSFSDHQSLFASATYYSKKTLIKTNIIHGDQRTGISWWGVPDFMLEEDRTYNPAGEYFDENGMRQYYSNQTDNYKQTHYQVLLSHEINDKLNLNFALHATTGSGYYEQYKIDEEFSSYGLPSIQLTDTLITVNNVPYVFEDSLIQQSDLVRRKMMDNIFYGATYSLNYTHKKVTSTLGGAWNKYDGDHFGRVIWSRFSGNSEKDYQWYNNNGTKTDFTLFGKLNYQVLKKLNAYGDIQYRRIKYGLTGPDDDLRQLDQEHSYNFVNPKFGAYYALSSHMDIYASYALSHREPTRTNFKDANGDDKATPDFETLHDIEFGYTYKNLNASFNINFYYMMYKNQLVPTGEKSNVGYDIMTNVNESYRRGIELIAGFKPNEKFDVNLNLTLSQNKIKDFIEHASYSDKDWNSFSYSKKLGETDISYSPNIIGTGIVTYEPIKNMHVSISGKYVGEQFIDNTSNDERKLDAYFICNAMAMYSISTQKIKEINFHVKVNNILNNEYISNAYGGNWYENALVENGEVISADEKSWVYYYPQSPIHFMAGVSIRF